MPWGRGVNVSRLAPKVWIWARYKRVELSPFPFSASGGLYPGGAYPGAGTPGAAAAAAYKAAAKAGELMWVSFLPASAAAPSLLPSPPQQGKGGFLCLPLAPPGTAPPPTPPPPAFPPLPPPPLPLALMPLARHGWISCPPRRLPVASLQDPLFWLSFLAPLERSHSPVLSGPARAASSAWTLGWCLSPSQWGEIGGGRGCSLHPHWGAGTLRTLPPPHPAGTCVALRG